MAILNPEQTSSAQWDFLVSTFTAEMAAGKRLSLVKDVRASLSLWSEFVPVVGVQLMDTREDVNATGSHLLYCDFVIQIATQSTQASATAAGYAIPNLDDAMKQARAILADGAGNGVASILRDPANRTLGGSASNSQIKAMHFQPDIRPGANANSNDPEIWTYCFIDFTTLQKIAII